MSTTAPSHMNMSSAQHERRAPQGGTPTRPTENQKAEAATWLRGLRDRIHRRLEALEDEYAGSAPAPARFVRTPWQRPNLKDDRPGGGGEMGVLRGTLFEKAGVNFSEVHGEFSPEFRVQIPGAEADGRFWACGVSLVIHPRNPFVPPVHMNLRHICTQYGWFGGGIDLNPIYPFPEDTAAFHAALKKTCAAFDPGYYPEFAAWCDRYFWLAHRNEPRGVGGIFYDNLDSGNWARDFAFTQAVGETFLEIYPQLVRTRMHTPWGEAERAHQKIRRGRYAEFNLLYDRGTLFGLKTGGNVEAILMSLPPDVAWP